MGTDKRLGKLFIKLANPNNDGVSEWVNVKDTPLGYEELNVTNGSSWSRNKSDLSENYIVEKEYGKSKGRPLLKVRVNGFNTDNDN